jgi:hypothetical protein
LLRRPLAIPQEPLAQVDAAALGSAALVTAGAAATGAALVAEQAAFGAAEQLLLFARMPSPERPQPRQPAKLSLAIAKIDNTTKPNTKFFITNPPDKNMMQPLHQLIFI